MDTEKCRALLAVLEAGSLSAAAEKLDYTPSGLSRMMAALEQELGFPLLSRSHSGLPDAAADAAGADALERSARRAGSRDPRRRDRHDRRRLRLRGVLRLAQPLHRPLL